MNEVRIGVFVCHCGSNIAGYLDCAAVREYAESLPGVVLAVENTYTCSESGIAEIQEAIRKHGLNRVVVASCSPRTHQPLFRSACAQAGLNPYLFEMVNIRDQCSWVHMKDREHATQKAMDLVRMGVAKAMFLEPQEDIESSLVRKALVIGGGVAGLSAAEAFSDMGLDVVLVEKEAQLGGLVPKLHRVAPAMDSGVDILSPLIQSVQARSNIKVLTASRVLNVNGVIGNYKITISTNDGEEIHDTVGCIVVATGAVPFRPEGLYGFNGRNVVTQFDLEQRLAQGPLEAQRIVMIQCAGARSKERPFCSRICCMTAVKNAILLKDAVPDRSVTVLYRDMQMYGTENEKLLWSSRQKGVQYHVYDAQNPPQVRNGEVEFYQPILGETLKLPFDLLVLSTPMVPPDEASELAQLMRTPTDTNHFFLEAHAKLRPLDFAVDGIYLCGAARYPATVAEARAQGLGAASRAATVLFKDKLVISGLVAHIDPATCVGCQGCMDVCPYGAIHYLENEGICQVNTLMCKGCGNCAATCPSASAQLRGFTHKQMLSQIKAVVGENFLC